jgi:uncharacterized membrane protein YebE (DUF533 family)
MAASAAPGTPLGPLHREPADEGTMVLGWLARIALVVAIVGVIGFDAIAIAQVHVRADDAASQAADQAATTWQATHDFARTVLVARTAAAQDDMTVAAKEVKVQPDGSVTVTVHGHVDTTVAKYVPGVQDLTNATSTANRKGSSS